MSWHGKVGHGVTRQARFVVARRGRSRPGLVRRGNGEAGVAWPGWSRPGKARPGGARRGTARQARQADVTITNGVEKWQKAMGMAAR